MVDFTCPNRRNKGLKPLVSRDPLTADLGFQAKRRQTLSIHGHFNHRDQIGAGTQPIA